MKSYSPQELLEIKESFLKELKDSDAGQKTSLSYIIHKIPETSLVKENESFQVLVIGGSVFKKALLRKVDGSLIIEKRDEKDQPPFDTKENFLSYIAQELYPDVSKVALNFAYPLEPVLERGRLDGVLLRGVKENAFEGLVDEKLGAAIEKYAKEKLEREITVSVANDTICLLLSGLTQFSSRDIAGGIVGTGMNFAMFLEENTLVNLEAASFNKFSQTDEGAYVDNKSNKPGASILEKEVSGGYLYKQFNYFIERDGLSLDPLSSTAQLDKLAQSDNVQVAEIANMIVKKSASLTACVMTAITEFKKTDTVFIMEGSLFWQGTRYKENVKEMLSHICPDYNITFGKIEDSPIYGGAKLIG